MACSLAESTAAWCIERRDATANGGAQSPPVEPVRVKQCWTDIEIAPGFTIGAWQSLCNRLDPDAFDDNWEKVVAHMHTRFAKRFLEPAEVLLSHEAQQIQEGTLPEGLGFTVLAIDCLLIETICGYEQGARTLVGGTSSAFEAFLSTAPRFKDAFAQGSRASAFANAIRNGLLHDGETRSGWIIWQGHAGGPIIDDLDGGVLGLYRSAFHSALKEHVSDYFARLRAKEGTQLRENLKKRIEQLCKESAPSMESP